MKRKSWWLAGMLGLAFGCAACRPEAPAPAAATSTAAASPELQALYDRSCRNCHGVAGSGAPLSGDIQAWTPRAAQGIDTLLDHTFDGYRAMPPMGACMDCSEEQFEQLIEMMSGMEFD